MTIVNQYQASKIAGVARQTINEKSKQVPRPAYFVQVTKDKKDPPYVDTEHPVWKAYLKTLRMRKGYAVDQEEKFNKLLAAVVDAVKEKFDLEDEELNGFLDMISNKYEES